MNTLGPRRHVRHPSHLTTTTNRRNRQYVTGTAEGSHESISTALAQSSTTRQCSEGEPRLAAVFQPRQDILPIHEGTRRASLAGSRPGPFLPRFEVGFSATLRACNLPSHRYGP